MRRTSQGKQKAVAEKAAILAASSDAAALLTQARQVYPEAFQR